MSKSYLVYDAYLCSEPNVDAGDRFTPPWQEVVLKSAYDDLKNEINNYRTHIDMSAYVQKQLEAKLKIAIEGIKRLRTFVRVDVKHGYISPEFADSTDESIEKLLVELTDQKSVFKQEKK
jgi:hypothetical protein